MVTSNSIQLHAVSWRAGVTGSPSPVLSLRSSTAIASAGSAHRRCHGAATSESPPGISRFSQLHSCLPAPALEARSCNNSPSTRQCTVIASEVCPIITDLSSCIQIQLRRDIWESPLHQIYYSSSCKITFPLLASTVTPCDAHANWR